jgi:hypothetical protein
MHFANHRIPHVLDIVERPVLEKLAEKCPPGTDFSILIEEELVLLRTPRPTID